MKKLINVLHFGIIGAGIGSIITTLSLLIMKAENASVKELIAWAVASFIIGIITTVMYTDRLNLLTATAIHFALTFATVAASCAVCGYGNSILETIKNMLPTFLIIYIIVYLIVFSVSKMNEKEINKALNNK